MEYTIKNQNHKGIQWLTRDNVIERVKVYATYKAYKVRLDFNFDNAETCQMIKDFIFSDAETIPTSALEKKLLALAVKVNDEAFGIENRKRTAKSAYINHYLVRGWNFELAKEKLLSQHQYNSKLFCTKDDILEYFKNENGYDINLNNEEYVKKLLDYIQMPFGNIWEWELYKQLRDFWRVYYKETLNLSGSRGYITGDIQYWLARGYSKLEAEEILDKKWREKSLVCVEFYEKHGINSDIAKQKISDLQRSYSKKARACKDYWLNAGYSEEDAKVMATSFSRLRSKLSMDYWVAQGYTEDEAKIKHLEANSSTPLYHQYQGDCLRYLKSLEIRTNKIKQTKEANWNNLTMEEKKAKLIQIYNKNVSKEEKICFTCLQDINPGIKHEPYPVVFPEDFKSKNNKMCYICDGYLNVGKDAVIIFEYDGGIGVYHHKDIDDIRDEEILAVDSQVMGIIHIEETLLKNLVFAETTNTKDIVINAINDIMSGKQLIITLK